MLCAGGRQLAGPSKIRSSKSRVVVTPSSSSSSAPGRRRALVKAAGYSTSAVNAIRAAQHEAVRQGRMFVAPPQLLLGLLAAPDSAAAQLLGAAGVSAHVAEAVLVDPQLLPASSSSRPGDLHFSPDARDALAAAAAAAADAGLPAAGTPHLLLGLLTCGNAAVASVLRRAGIESADALLEQVRAAASTCSEESQQAQPASGADQAAALVQQYQKWTATSGHTPGPDGGVGGVRVPAPGAMVFTPEDDDIYN